MVIKQGKVINLSPPMIISLGFVALITLGTLLLMLPMAATESTSLLSALFTATSAVTVTGLGVVDTGTHFTTFGQVVIALLIQAGGLGFMTFTVVAASMLGAKIGIKQQRVAQEAFNQTSLENLTQIAKAVLWYSLIIEGIGILLLTLLWHSEFGWGTAVYRAFFYSISAFNNAGFALDANNLMPYVRNAGVNVVISALFMIGGIGFVVLMDLRQKKVWSKLSTNTRIVLTTTFFLNISAFLLLWLLEARNPNTLGSLSWGDQALAAWFQAVSPRTAGFNTLAMDQLTNASTFLTMFLMFIGAGSLSTASGIKVGTFAILLVATYSVLRQQDEVVVFKRTIPLQQVMKALALMVVAAFLIFLGIFVLDVTEKASFLDISFEVVSALGTVGLSRGLTPKLSEAGQLMIIFLMIAGRLGPLTLAYSFAVPKHDLIRYPETNIQIG
ncbi:MAG TPA: TrkH family potassium uptake protein [Thiolinea sp.]|nr:TrkH family potassium uptake protein [Thiolinea sp.]